MLDITLELRQVDNTSDEIHEWWSVNQTEPGPIPKREKYKVEGGLELYVFSDQVSPPSLGFLAGYGYVVKCLCVHSGNVVFI